jgi:hypothetical protein
MYIKYYDSEARAEAVKGKQKFAQLEQLHMASKLKYIGPIMTSWQSVTSYNMSSSISKQLNKLG